MKRIHILPNLITMANAFCGFLAIIKITRALHEHEPQFLLHGAWYIFLAMVFDALDGKVARMVNAATDFGSQLDSLCDVLSFGVAPAYLVYVMQVQLASEIGQTVYKENFLFIASALFVCCAILRLARFNVEVGLQEEDHRVFKGIPTPAAAGILASLVIGFFNPRIAEIMQDHAWQSWILTALPWYTLACSILMVSSVRFVHLISIVSRSRVRFEYLVGFVALVVLVYTNPELSLLIGCQLYLLSGACTGYFIKKLQQKARISSEE